MQRLIIYQLNFSKFILRLCFPSFPTNKINKTNKQSRSPIASGKLCEQIKRLYSNFTSSQIQFQWNYRCVHTTESTCLKLHHVTDSGGDDIFIVTFVDLLAAFEVLSDKSLPSPDLRWCEVEKLFIDESRPRGCAPGHPVLHTHSVWRQLGCELEHNQRKTTVKSLWKKTTATARILIGRENYIYRS